VVPALYHGAISDVAAALTQLTQLTQLNISRNHVGPRPQATMQSLLRLPVLNTLHLDSVGLNGGHTAVAAVVAAATPELQLMTLNGNHVLSTNVADHIKHLARKQLTMQTTL